jgi:hypothetical protein
MKPKPLDPYLLETATDPRKHEMPSAWELLGASFEAAGKGAEAGIRAIEKIIMFLFWVVISLVALNFLS